MFGFNPENEVDDAVRAVDNIEQAVGGAPAAYVAGAEANALVVHPAVKNLFEQHLNLTERPTPHLVEMPLRTAVALFGLGWGIPWMTAASEAAAIFPAKDQAAFEAIFAAGIVWTVGLDGLWVMLEIGKFLGAKTQTEKTLFSRSDTLGNNILKYALPPVLSAVSCISPVYATVKYNNGASQFLSIITFVGNFGYGLYGYFRLLDQLLVWRDFNKNKRDYTVGQQNKETILANIKGILSKETFPQNDEILQSIFNTAQLARELPPQDQASLMKKTFQLLPTALICGVSSFIGFFLTRNFFEEVITPNPFVVYLFTLLAEIPGFVVGVISNYEFFGRLFDLLSGSTTDPKSQLISQQYPAFSKLLPGLILLMSLLAPTAAGYVIYNTFHDEGLDLGTVWAATAIIILARVTFANFTQTRLFDEALAEKYARSNAPEDTWNRKRRLIEYSDALSGVRPQFFQDDTRPSLSVHRYGEVENALRVER